MNQSGRKATRNTVWRTLLCSFDDEHQQHYPGRTMLVAFSILTLLNQLNFLSISAWHVQTYFHSNLVRFVLRGIPAFLSILLIFCAVRIMKPKVELGQWLRWPPQHVWGRRLTAFVLLAIILVAVGSVVDRHIFQRFGWRGKMFAPDEAQTQWFRYLLQMPTIFGGEYLFDVCLVPVVEDILFVGILFPSLRSRFNGLFAACLTSFLFICGHDLRGLWHTLTAGGFASWFAIGFLGTVVKCWVLNRFRSLYPCILLHIFFNFWNVFPDVLQALLE